MSDLSFKNIVDQYNELLTRTAKYDYFVRDAQIQKMTIEELKSRIAVLKGFKRQARERNDEEAANAFLHMQCVLYSRISSLSMWIELKRHKFHRAWDHLIDAQEYLAYAKRASSKGFGIDDLVAKLVKVEQGIFPGFPLYNSLGLTFKGGVCSVCGKKLEECEHIEEKIYYGVVCRRIRIESIDVDHTALVAEPKDRRCIISEVEDDNGEMRDYITWKVLRKKSTADDKGKIIRGVVYNSHDLDLS
jgi:hypothetical protein